MLQGTLVRLRAQTRDDLPRLCEFNNGLIMGLLRAEWQGQA